MVPLGYNESILNYTNLFCLQRKETSWRTARATITHNDFLPLGMADSMLRAWLYFESMILSATFDRNDDRAALASCDNYNPLYTAHFIEKKWGDNVVATHYGPYSAKYMFIDHQHENCPNQPRTYLKDAIHIAEHDSYDIIIPKPPWTRHGGCWWPCADLAPGCICVICCFTETRQMPWCQPCVNSSGQPHCEQLASC